MMLRSFGFVFLMSALLVAPASAQPQLAAAMQKVRAALTAKDGPAAVAAADSLIAQYPEYPNAVFLRTRALMLGGRTADAERSLRTLLAWDARFAARALQDSMLMPLSAKLTDLNIAAIAARLDSATTVGTVFATVDERDLVPEGTAWDPFTKSVLLGSLNKNKIVAISSDGRVTERVTPGSNGLASVVGIHVDSARGTLWVASNRRFDRPQDSTVSALFAFDVRTGAFRKRIDSPVKGPNFFNDLTTGRDGTVYLTDSQGGRVWMLAPGANALVAFAPLNNIASPNGITISNDGRHLFVADFDRIRVVDLESKVAWQLTVPDSLNVSGIDGLTFANGELIAHHPLGFWRIARYRLDDSFRRIISRRLIERSTADGRTSTTGEVAGDTYYFIGNSQIDRMNAGTIDSGSMESVRIYSATLRSPPG